MAERRLKKGEFNLGARLQAVREGLGLSQRELARRAGVTNGTISLIEQNKNSPSVASLKKVLDGIPMSLDEFFTLELPSEDQVFFAAHELVELIDGPISFRQLGGGGHNLEMLYERYSPGADTGETMLRHEGQEGGIVIRGRIEITIGDRCRVLGPGEAYFFVSRLPHRFRNVDKEECEIISACSPPYLSAKHRL